MTTQSTQDASDPLAVASNRIRDAGKWLIAAAAGVGAALIAGSQLSSIGKLSVCTPTSEQCLRLPLSLLAAVVGLVSIAFIMWSAGRLLLPVEVTITDLADHWDSPRREWADAKFFKKNPAYLGYGHPRELEQARTDTWTRLTDAEATAESASGPQRENLERDIVQARKEFDEVQDRTMTVTKIAEYQLLKDEYTHFARKLLPAAALAAIGVVIFAWAANPPSPDVPSVTMKGAILAGADLRQANLKVSISAARICAALICGVPSLMELT